MKNLSTQQASRRAGVSGALWLAALGIFIVLGYSVFRGFASAADASLINLYLLAVVAGVASFFSPCAFPLLPTYLAFYHKAQEDAGGSAKKRKPLFLGAAAALGVMSFNVLLGLLVAALGSGVAEGLSVASASPQRFVQAFRGAVGLALALFGIGQLAGWNLRPYLGEAFAHRLRPEREGRRSAAINLFLYGFGYNAAGMGCTGPILAGLIVLAISSGGFAAAMTAFLIFSFTMGTLMLLTSAIVAASRQGLIQQLKAASPKIKRASAILMLLVGLFNIYSVIRPQFFLDLLFP